MILSRHFIALVCAVLIFMLCLWQGFNMAFKKQLWNDEIYTQIASVESVSWPQIWTGGIREGNNSPLFYSIQKAICAAFDYKSYDLWNKQNIDSQFILRIAPVVCMALGLALIVFFFGINYSWVGGIVAFIVSISSYMVWYYWAEARPYALMFLGTTVQTLVLLQYYRQNKGRAWTVGAANVFVALISSLSVIQIAASGAVLWLKGERRIGPLAACVVLPFLIAVFYYLRADHYAFMFSSYSSPLNLIQANIPAGRLMAFFIIPVLIWAWDHFFLKNKEFMLWPFFVWGWLTIAGYALFLGYLWMIQDPSKGFEVSNRYLMALTPIGIIGVSVALLELMRRPQVLWAKFLVWVAVAMLILPRLKKTFSWFAGM